MTEAEVAGWHHQFSGLHFGQILGDVKDKEIWWAAVYEVIRVGFD